MSKKRRPKQRDMLPLPVEVMRQHPGKQIIYSDELGRVLGVGDTLDEAYDQAMASGVNGQWHFGYGHTADELIF